MGISFEAKAKLKTFAVRSLKLKRAVDGHATLSAVANHYYQAECWFCGRQVDKQDPYSHGILVCSIPERKKQGLEI